MQLLIEGRATARVEDSGARLDEYGPGDVLMVQAVFGERPADISVTATEPCRTALMTPAARLSLEPDNPELAAELDRYLIETLLEYQARLLPGVRAAGNRPVR